MTREGQVSIRATSVYMHHAWVTRGGGVVCMAATWPKVGPHFGFCVLVSNYVHGYYGVGA